MAFTPKLTYKGKPLVRKDNELYYGNMVTIFFCKIAYFYHICLPDMM